MDWVAYASVIAAGFSAIATGLAAIAAYRAPIRAAEFADRLRLSGEREHEQRRMRTVIFFTLMQERATLASSLSVQMLNAIDSVFYDVGPVREAWADLYHTLSRLSDTPSTTVEDKHRELLRQMSINLGLSDALKRDDFSRTYFPTVLAEEHYVQNLRRASERRRLEHPEDTSGSTANAAAIFAGEVSPFPPKPT